jgi:hypothetical protein
MAKALKIAQLNVVVAALHTIEAKKLAENTGLLYLCTQTTGSACLTFWGSQYELQVIMNIFQGKPMSTTPSNAAQR